MLRLERAIVSRLGHGTSELYAIDPGALPALSHVLASVLKGPDAAAEVIRGLALSVALENELRSPSAAIAIHGLLRSDPLVVRLIRLHLLRPAAMDQRRRFLRSEGRDAALIAPRFGDENVDGTLHLSAFLSPIGVRGVSRVVRSEARELPVLRMKVKR
jgi:hypothetical protein